jgi:predicted MFS family arabinose efflux permease
LSRPLPERTIVLLVGAVQFINILDFMMVMPLGPYFAAGLGIPNSHVGIIAGSYTAAAAVSGLLSLAVNLDRFDRRKALGLAMVGLVLGTAAGGFATGLTSLIVARVIAGLFGGPATSLSFSIIADVIPAERRGKAVSSVMSAFAIASIFGVPAGLWLALHGGWRLPFFSTAAMGVPVVLVSMFYLPPLTGHVALGLAHAASTRTADLFREPLILSSYLMTAVVMMGGFVLIPNITPHLQQNLGYPAAHIPYLYAAGGVVSWVSSSCSSCSRWPSATCRTTPSRRRSPRRRCARGSWRCSRRPSTSPPPRGRSSPRSCCTTSPTAASRGCRTSR